MYDRQAAVKYARYWALKRNPNYADFENMGGDCTNYISQCLYAGGIEFSYNAMGWFYHSLSSRAPAWTGVDEFFDFSTNNFHRTGPRLKLSYLQQMQEGDVIQLKVNSLWTHTLIISQIIEPKTVSSIFVCAHSNDVLNKRLSMYNYSEIRFLKVLNE